MENNFIYSIQDKKKLAYSSEFKKLIHENPNVIVDFFTAIDNLKNVGEKKYC